MILTSNCWNYMVSCSSWFISKYFILFWWSSFTSLMKKQWKQVALKIKDPLKSFIITDRLRKIREEKLFEGPIIRKKERLSSFSILVLITKFNVKINNFVKANVKENNLSGIFSYMIALISSWCGHRLNT